ncbi:MAG: hypothetical protein PHQ03_01160 [Methylococcales bacterium]|nr:hypothetical protein [Methylococcales bacterium]
MSSLLQELNEFSLKITELIDLNDWEQLCEILTQRQARLSLLANTQLSLEEQSVLESIQAMDKLFIESIQLKKMALLKDFQTVAQGQKSIKAYYATATN